MTVTPFKFPPSPPAPGQAFSRAPFTELVTVVPPRWVADPLEQRSAILRMECRQHDGRSEMIATQRVNRGDEAWLCVEYHLTTECLIDPDFTTLSQIHYVETADVPPGSPMSQMVARPGGHLVASLRTTPSASKWGGADVPLTDWLPGHRVYVVHQVIGGVVVWIGAHSQPFSTPNVGAPLTWPADCYAYGPQVGVYRGQTQTASTVVYVAAVGWASTYAAASQLAGWTNPAPDEYAQARVEMENFKSSSPHVWSALDHTLKGLGH